MIPEEKEALKGCGFLVLVSTLLIAMFLWAIPIADRAMAWIAEFLKVNGVKIPD